MSRLATGLRINTAGDDPAGIAISERLRTQYRNSAAAASNVEGKINYIQTADSWMQKIHDMIGRMAELAVMANDGAKSQIDRDNLQKEFAQMQKEIQRITSGATAAAKYNQIDLFRGKVPGELGTPQMAIAEHTRRVTATTVPLGDFSDVPTAEWSAVYDVAFEMMQFTRSKVLQEISSAMLTQANAMSQIVLQLLSR